MSGTFNSNTNTSRAEPSSNAQATKDLIDQPITPLSITPLAPAPDSAAHSILATSNNSTQDIEGPNSQAFKPQVFRRKSSNYEDAAKRASGDFSANKSEDCSEPAIVKKIGDLVDSVTKQKGPENGAAAEWQPKFERKQSWDHQDWKHDLQMAVAGKEKKDDDNTALGFTETGAGGNNKRYSQS